MLIRPDFLGWGGAFLRFCAAAVVLITMASQCVADVCDGNGGTVAPAFVSSTDYRSLVAGVAGSTPAVGSALGGIVKVLWQDPGPGSLFEQMKEYVNVVVPEFISAEHAQMLENDAKGFQNLVNDYQNTTNLMQKGEYLTSLISQLDVMEPNFFDPRVPESVLGSFVQYATIKLYALREQLLFSKDYYGDNLDYDRHLQLLQSTEKKYAAAVLDISKRAMDWRLSKLHVADWREPRGCFGNSCPPVHLYRAQDEFCPWYGGKYEDDQQARARGELQSRHNQVSDAYAKDLKIILSPTDSWASLAELPSSNPSNGPNRQPPPSCGKHGGRGC